jgi:hypothetical protein
MRQIEAIKLVKKLECLGLGYPRTAEGVSALSDALIAIAGSSEMAEWLVQQAIFGCPRCPTPLELRRIMERKAPAADGITARSLDATDLMSGPSAKE